MAESLGLVVAGQFAGPGVEGCAYECRVEREGGEDQAVAGGGVPGWFGQSGQVSILIR